MNSSNHRITFPIEIHNTSIMPWIRILCLDRSCLQIIECNLQRTKYSIELYYHYVMETDHWRVFNQWGRIINVLINFIQFHTILKPIHKVPFLHTSKVNLSVSDLIEHMYLCVFAHYGVLYLLCRWIMLIYSFIMHLSCIHPIKIST